MQPKLDIWPRSGPLLRLRRGNFIDPMTIMSLMSMFGGGGQGGGGGGENFGLGSLGAAFGGSLLGGHLASKRAKKDKKKLEKRIGRAIGVTESIQGRGLQQQEALSRLATKQRLGGYDTARSEAGRLGRAGKQGALDRGQQMEARVSQGLQNRGLGSTTVGANLSRGVAADTSRSMQSIDEGLAGLYGDLALGRAGAEAAGSDQLSALAGQRGDVMSQLAQMRILKGGQLGNIQAPLGSTQSGFEMALPGMMQGLGSYMGSQGGQQPISMEQLQWLFGGRPGSMGYGGKPAVGSGYYNTFDSGS